ncbi:MAG: type II toxin-antitoxin system RelE/ParE family toxin [Minwuia sp.]|nr:type II toxin-antitoxin system RelE/ParE family toxin [Minwuia sp.]
MMELTITKRAGKELAKAPAHVRAAVIEKIKSISTGTDAANLDIRPLAGSTDEFRLRHGAYRAIFTIQDDILTVTAFGPRGGIYNR